MDLVEAICLVGKELSDWEDARHDDRSPKNPWRRKHIRVVTYQQLIHDAEASYRQYLEKSKDKGRIKKLLAEIDAAPMKDENDS